MLQAPGVKATGPNGAYSIAGAASFETLYMVNGVSIMDNLRGTPFDLYVEDAIQETTVAVAGVSAEFGRFGGGVVNVITKSGGNIFSGTFRDTLNNDNWRTLTPFEETAIANDPAHRELRIAKTVPDYSYTFSGPVVKDQLWFFTAGRFQSQESGRTLLATNIPYTLTDSSQRYEGKVTYSATARHRFQGDYIKIAQTQSNFSNNAAAMDVRSLGERKIPQSLFTMNYNGVLSNKLFVEGRFSSRKLAFDGAGAKSTDRIEGTLLIDQSRNGRFWSDTFCGVCGPEERNNRDFFVKGSYFLSRKGSGSHNLSVGYDNYNDLRSANNHQSGSDYRILGTSSFLLPSGDVVPQFLGNDTTFIQYNPLPLLSQGANFQTHSAFLQDSWRERPREREPRTALGQNHGVDQSGAVTADDSGWSPRIGIVWDPNGKGQWAVSGSFAKYTAAISNPIADSGSAAGNPQSYIWFYRGPNINTLGPVTQTPDAIRQVFAWLDANGGTSRQIGFVQPPTIPGLTPRIDGSLESPYNLEYSGGVSRQFGARASLRADVSYRDFHNAYVNRIDQSTGKVTNSFGQSFDLAHSKRQRRLAEAACGPDHVGMPFTSRVYAGGNSRVHAWATSTARPSTAVRWRAPRQFPLRRPRGTIRDDLQIDQRHRARLWYVHGMPKIECLTLSFLQTLESGVPYSASNINNASANGVNPRPFVTLPPGFSYVNAPTGASTTYFFTSRDGFRTEGQMRTDLAVNYNYRLKGSRLELFGQLQVLNLFDNFQLCGCGGTVFQNGGAVSQTRIDTTVRTNVTNPALYAAFNPFTTTPVEGVNWAKGPVFGTALNRFAYTSPRELRLSFGVRF